MMDSIEFEKWGNNISLTKEAMKEIQRVRQSPPARRVGGGKQNVSGRYSSRKMGVTVQFESHKVELPIIYLLEYNDEVIEYYDQPTKIKILYEQNGKKIAYWKTPDFFVLEKNRAYWIECKTEDELIKKSQQHPERYFREDNKWVFAPGKNYSKDFGLDFIVHSSKDVNWYLQRNLNFLEDYIINEYLPLEYTVEKIKELVTSSPGLTLSELFDMNQEEFSADDIYSLIANNTIYIDLNNSLITEWNNTKVFFNKQQSKSFGIVEKSSQRKSRNSVIKMESGARFIWGSDTWNILNYDFNSNIIFLYNEGSKKNVELPLDLFEIYISEGYIKGVSEEVSGPADQITTMILQASEKDLKEANDKYTVVIKYINGEDVKLPNITERTLRNWINKFNKAKELYGNGYIGLLPKTKNRGNREPKLPIETKELMNTVIGESFENIKAKSMKTVYRELRERCKKADLIAPSYQTFCNTINNRSKYEMEKARKGERAAYKYEPIYTELKFTTPKHGDRIFEIAHIDHTELDIELNINNKGTKRPWLTLMMDAYSRRVLAFYLTFEEPSYRSCMMVIRKCVKNYNRLPNYIVVDKGKEFGSVYFESLLARYGVNKKERPSAKARFGSVIERLFGTANSLLIHNLKGNTQITKNVRQVTKSVNPKNHAIWTLEALDEILNTWFRDIYDNKENHSLNQTPKEAFEESKTLSGDRPNTYIPYDETFILTTLPSPKGKVRKVQPGQGVKLMYSYYWCEEFKHPKLENSIVEVKYDPFNMGIVYAYVQNKWIKCLSEQYKYLEGKTERQVQLIAEEIREKNKRQYRYDTVTGGMLANYILEVEDKEKHLEFEKHKCSDNKETDYSNKREGRQKNNDQSKYLYDDDELEIFEELI